MKPQIAAITFAALLSGCSEVPSSGDHANDGQPEKALVASAAMVDPAGMEVGSVKILSSDTGLVIGAQIGALPAGDSGFHLHAIGRCDGPDFKSAGGHLNPHGKQHGRQNPAGQHLGDLPNLTISGDGTVSTEIGLSGSVDEILAQIFDEDGTAVVVHEQADDYASDPSGNAGARIACGILSKA